MLVSGHLGMLALSVIWIFPLALILSRGVRDIECLWMLVQGKIGMFKLSISQIFPLKMGGCIGSSVWDRKIGGD